MKLWVPCAALSLVSAVDRDFRVVAAVGDSITFGATASDRSVASWPARLQLMLLNNDPSVVVRNFGVSGSTALVASDKPYWELSRYAEALASNPDVVVIQFGTNDAKFRNWDENRFRADLTALVRSFARLETSPKIWVSVPPPIYEHHSAQYKMNRTVINSVLPALIPEVAAACGVGVIDVFGALGGASLDAWELFCDYQSCDGVHPNDAGYVRLAAKVFSQVFFTADGGLAPLLGDGHGAGKDGDCTPRNRKSAVLSRNVWVAAAVSACLASCLTALALALERRRRRRLRGGWSSISQKTPSPACSPERGFELRRGSSMCESVTSVDSDDGRVLGQAMV